MTRILPRQCCLVPNVVYVICGQCLYMCPQILLKISHFFYYGNAWNGKKYWFANQNYLTWIFLVIWQCLFLRFDNWHLTFTFAISRFALVEKSHFWTLAKISVFLSGTKSNLTEKPKFSDKELVKIYLLLCINHEKIGAAVFHSWFIMQC